MNRMFCLPELASVWQSTLQWQPNNEQQQQFQRLYQEILLGNRQFNLTRITAPNDFWEKHLWDSLAGLIGRELDLAEPSLKVIDIGTGAGFPGLPVAIAFPSWQVTLLDSTRKKVLFLDTLLARLELENVTTLIGRAEEVGQQPLHREAYDIALVRAVGSASVCAEYAIPLLKPGGLAVLYRGQWSDQDRADLQLALEELGSQIQRVKQLSTPLSQSVRHCVYLHKLAPTSAKYPRTGGIPAQKPL